MDHRMPFDTEPSWTRMRVRVAAEQHELKKHDARVPDRRRSAKRWKHHLRGHRLEQKHQDGACGQRQTEHGDSAVIRRVGDPLLRCEI